MSQSNKVFKVLILIGFHIDDGQVTHFRKLSSPYYDLFDEKIIEQYDVRTSKDVSNALLTLNEGKVTDCIIIYCGHGDGRNDQDEPFIRPYNNSINLLDHNPVSNADKMIVRFKYILDCCNVDDQELMTETDIKQSQQVSASKMNLLFNSDWKSLYTRKGIYNRVSGRGTLLNLYLVKSILEYETNSITEIFECCNSLLRKHFVEKKLIQNKRIKNVLDSNIKVSYKPLKNYKRINRITFSNVTHNSLNLKDIIKIKDLQRDLFNDDENSMKLG